MKNSFICFMLIFALFGCSGKVSENKQLLAKVGSYEITLDEFESEFKDSPYFRDDTLESRKEFLNLLIGRKLILQDAQNKGLDKEKEFLRLIERFWEQSLLKVALDRRGKETAVTNQVSDREIRQAFDMLVKEGKANKSFEQMYTQIKWEIAREKESRLMEQWLAGLKKETGVQTELDLLKK